MNEYECDRFDLIFMWDPTHLTEFVGNMGQIDQIRYVENVDQLVKPI